MRRRNRRLQVLFKEAHISKKIDKKKKKKTVVKEQENRKNKKTIALAFWALGTILLILLIGKLFVFLASLDKPYTPEYQPAKNYRWNGAYSYNLIIKAQDLGLVTIDPFNKQVTVIKVPDDTQIDLPKGYGNYPASSIYDLGQAERPPVGPSLMKASFAHLFGLPVDGFVLVAENEKFKTVEEIVASLRKSPISALSLVKNIKTDLSPNEGLRILSVITSLREDKLKIVDIGQTSITESKLLPDTTRVLGVDTIHLDLFVRQRMKDPVLLNEEASVAVFNATDHPGLAQEASRILTNMGVNVINVSNTPTLKESSQVVVTSQELKEKTRVRVAQLFAPKCITQKCESSDDKVVNSRADITIVLGEDYFRRRSDKASPF